MSPDSRQAEALRAGNISGKKIFALLALILFVSTASATDIVREDVTVDLADSTVDTDVVVGDLTSNAFIYITSTDISDVNATLEGEEMNCSTREIALGSEIRCETDRKSNFTVHLNYQVEDLIEYQGKTNIFRYQHPIYRPTDEYDLEVILPEGTALMNRENESQQVISPLGAETDTNGRRISVKWHLEPDLGDTLSFYILYEDFTPSEEPAFQSYRELLIIILGLLAIGLVAFLVRRRLRRENLSDEYPDLDEDEEEVLDILKESDGEYLQKDLVDELDYSKAKVSGIVSGLVDKGVIEKKKEGRSNKLVIPKKYSY
ncbi:helix-turn-helix transcriptional regulator [Candidatus Nanosalina sp. VS9-1]|uniref:helix-turn-helix transcriptional regulator n=1 Tax=Candidatus Nanosalina sp. VS9-1 TaxID=3388566 RepID=UPI0039E1EAC7